MALQFTGYIRPCACVIMQVSDTKCFYFHLTQFSLFREIWFTSNTINLLTELNCWYLWLDFRFRTLYETNRRIKWQRCFKFREIRPTRSRTPNNILGSSGFLHLPDQDTFPRNSDIKVMFYYLGWLIGR